MIDRVLKLSKASQEGPSVSESELEEITLAWEEWIKRDDAILSMMHSEILIQN